MKNVGQLLNELQNLKNKEQAKDWLIEETKQNSNTWVNVKYVTGYLDNEERNRILKLFNRD